MRGSSRRTQMTPELYGLDMIGELEPIPWSVQPVEDEAERCRMYASSTVEIDELFDPRFGDPMQAR
jgi:hypothetical protein